MSKVYVLNKGYDYEGESTLGVYSNTASAMKDATADAITCGHLDEGSELDFRQTNSGIWVACPGTPTFYIYEMEVKP